MGVDFVYLTFFYFVFLTNQFTHFSCALTASPPTKHELFPSLHIVGYYDIVFVYLTSISLSNFSFNNAAQSQFT